MSQQDQDLPERNVTDVGRRRVLMATALFLTIVVLITVDLVDDANTGADVAHLSGEALVMTLAAIGVVTLWRGLNAAKARVARLDVNLEAALAEASRYKAEAQEALLGLGAAIDSQFERWQLTPAEREVGLLLLKGLSHKEIASVRHTSEPTVRQQALMVYRKAGLRSRSDLSAFFLEDLLLPRSLAEPQGVHVSQARHASPSESK